MFFASYSSLCWLFFA